MSDHESTKIRADRSTALAGSTPGNPGNDPVKILTEILNQVRAGFERPPLSAEAERAIAVYARNRLTLGDKPAQAPTPVK